ncbi:ABC transporter permease [Antrihabitans stalactiti]|uniref:Transport permease protein n=1 Tax=Antrihabitans stalactiti TaxID=2584121 RepID=A0A848KGY1_9NOCA|nr:ABC transporter permease [Antrihabitans stalactiti]NMN96344.1 peptide ABC transporter permease [Antrihabitans stalactiti]
MQLPIVEHRVSEFSLRALFAHSFIHCNRILLKWVRDYSTTIQALLYPALTLVMLRIVFGDSISKATGVSSIYGTTAMITIIAAMTGSMVSALGLKSEAETGLLGRFATLPVHRASGLVGRMLAEAFRIVFTTILILMVGVFLGFRFTQGPVAGFTLILLPMIFGMAFVMFVTALATVPGRAPLVEIVSILTTLLMFFNTGFVPKVAYPIWLQNTVANQPMSCAIDAMKGLALGGPVSEPLLKTVAWSIGIIVVFAYPAVRGYRRAAETGR